MAVDTASKRFSMTGILNPMILHNMPAGSVNAAKRATFMDLYEGIALANPSGVTVLDYERGLNRGLALGIGRGM